MIAYAVTAFFDWMPFPGPNALLPCIGAALIIFAGKAKPNPLGRMLEFRPLTFVGLISYSLYLWSWPIEVYANYVSPFGLNADGVVIAIVLSLLLAILSWRFVERPFRGSKALFSAKTMFVLSGSMAVVLAACGFVLFATRGLPQRLPPEIARRIADFHTASNIDDVFQHGCYEHLSYRQFLQAGVCHFGAGQPDLLLWGDSHAAAIVPALELLICLQGLLPDVARVEWSVS